MRPLGSPTVSIRVTRPTTIASAVRASALSLIRTKVVARAAGVVRMMRAPMASVVGIRTCRLPPALARARAPCRSATRVPGSALREDVRIFARDARRGARRMTRRRLRDAGPGRGEHGGCAVRARERVDRRREAVERGRCEGAPGERAELRVELRGRGEVLGIAARM